MILENSHIDLNATEKESFLNHSDDDEKKIV
jgi:hypothetical protein